MEPYDPYLPRAPRRGAHSAGSRPPAADNDGNPIEPEQDLDQVRDEADAAAAALRDGARKRRARVGKALDGRSTGSRPKARAEEEPEGVATSATVAAGQLRAFIERIERHAEEKQAIADDIKEVYAEAKATGFDTKAVRAIVKMRKMDDAERQEEEAIIDLYKAALGMR